MNTEINDALFRHYVNRFRCEVANQIGNKLFYVVEKQILGQFVFRSGEAIWNQIGNQWDRLFRNQIHEVRGEAVWTKQI